MEKKIRTRTFPGTTNPAPRPYEAAHAGLAREAAAEGIVLLENKDDFLPISAGSIALYGAGAAHTVKGGTGSGDVNERASVSILEGLRDTGFTITTDAWLEGFELQYTQARQAWKEAILAKANAPASPSSHNFFMAYSTTPFFYPVGPAVTKTEADTALYVLSRIAGEGIDRSNGEGDYLLSGEEHAMLADICRLYRNVVLLVNTGSVVDLSFLEEFSNIQSVLYLCQPGMEGGHAVADVLTGLVNPSGHLTDSWAFHYEDYPNAASFSHCNGDVVNERYEEGLYVGYRYFDSFEVPVRYCFGYGLSYTSFTLCAGQLNAAPDGTVTLPVTVENTGSRAGREVVQLYASLPCGTLEKEARRLCAFGKTSLLQPGQSETLSLSFTALDLASYQPEGAAWLLEKGTYGLYLGTSLSESRLAAALALDKDTVLTKIVSVCPLQSPLQELHLSPEKRAARAAAVRKAAEAVPTLAYDLSAVTLQTVAAGAPAEPMDDAARLVDTLSTEQLVLLATGDPGMGQGSALGSAGVNVPGSAAETSACATAQGLAPIVLADGPAGLRLNKEYTVSKGRIEKKPFEASIEHGFFCEGQELTGEKHYQFCTAIPVGTLLAQTWDSALLEHLGRIVSEEMKEFGVTLWLAPGMNIHRNPLCGRNFEYYSEDPLLSGRMAAAMTRGVQSQPGYGTTIKHFACNNQEDNRHGSDSILSERVLREIYLRGFGIAIRESHPLALMTSYNRVNGIYAANSRDLCTQIARSEFGFDGVIMTDWTATIATEGCTASGCIRAGNDLIMPGVPSDHDDLRQALADGSLSLAELRTCITHLARVALQADCYE